MKRAFLVLACWCQLAGTALADHQAIVFTVYRTTDIKNIVSRQGIAGLSSIDNQNNEIARGYATPGSTTMVNTGSFQVMVQVAKSPIVVLDTDEYSYNLTWYDQVARRDIFSLRGRIKPGPVPTLPENWDKNEFTIVFKLENLKQ